MRLIFMGTPDFAVPVLKALMSEHDVVCVYTQPPSPSGRGQALEKSAIHQEAEKNGIEVRCPVSLKNQEEQDKFKALNADVAVVCAYGLILPQAILCACPKGCINVHASLLPRWRGAAPIQRAIMAGDKQSGVTIMQMGEGLDTGDMLMSEAVNIDENMTYGELHDKLSILGSKLIVEVLDNTPTPIPQTDECSTYAKKIDKGECEIDWNKPAPEIHNLIRGLNPYPKAYLTSCTGEKIKVLASHVVDNNQNESILSAAGTVLDNNLTIACGSGTALQLDCLQRSGKKPLSRSDFLNGLRGNMLCKGERV